MGNVPSQIDNEVIYKFYNKVNIQDVPTFLGASSSNFHCRPYNEDTRRGMLTLHGDARFLPYRGVLTRRGNARFRPYSGVLTRPVGRLEDAYYHPYHNGTRPVVLIRHEDAMFGYGHSDSVRYLPIGNVGSNDNARPGILDELHECPDLAYLSEYLDDVYQSVLCFKRGDDEVQDIKLAVQKMLSNLQAEIGKVDPRFEISDLLFVGSMAEGTKIEEPDEFDFLAVIKSLSLSNDVKVLRECGDNTGTVHIQITNPELRHTYQQFMVNRMLNASGGQTSFVAKFMFSVRKAIENRRSDIIEAISGYLTTTQETFPIAMIHGPANKFDLMWNPKGRHRHPLRISVDLTPAIQFADIETVISQEEVEDKVLYQKLRQSKTFMAVMVKNDECHNRDMCCRLAFTNTEVRMVQEWSAHHKKCYQILKGLLNAPNSEACDCTCSIVCVICSYALKTFVLKHAHRNSCDGTFKCILDILEELEMCMKSGTQRDEYESVYYRFSSFFLPSSNVFSKPVKISYWDKHLKGITNMRQRLNVVNIARS